VKIEASLKGIKYEAVYLLIFRQQVKPVSGTGRLFHFSNTHTKSMR